eukprot:CAMPEP_0172392672 /NCGR_PEP_ID=MMETSP1061-20121228/8729_1 /TAXON_ID=37318 /ORGANISM="Pseudo-nitzschia pungens, Strain cf. pungens" /LENGTH=240 /DNA_ID=CAMNT_0013123551 /DNA_START=363 /DNA_END=1085 /DNA_ORIENTATION=-
MSSSPKQQQPLLSPLPPPLRCTCSVFIATSQDGFIADKDNGVDWLNDLQQSHPLPEGEDGGFSDFMDGVDAIVMGRVTYDTVLGFVRDGLVPEWPYGNKPLYVFTRTLESVRLLPKDYYYTDSVGGDAIVVKPISGQPASVLSTVAKEVGAATAATATAPATSSDDNNPTRAMINVYIDGGGCIRSFLDAGLVTSAIITKVPVTLGEGVPLFSQEHTSKLKEVTSITLANGFVQTTFEVQ